MYSPFLLIGILSNLINFLRHVQKLLVQRTEKTTYCFTHIHAHTGPYRFLSFYSLSYRLAPHSGPPSHPIALGSHLQSLLLQGHSITAGLANLASFAPSYTEAKYGICRCLLPAFDFCHHLPSPKPVSKGRDEVC